MKVEPFELALDDWHPRVNASNVLVSSLLLHHVPDFEKAPLFNAVFERLRSPGGLFIADVVQAQRPEQRSLYADTYDAVAFAQSMARTGTEETFNVFLEKHWNVFRYSLPEDEYPSPLIRC